MNVRSALGAICAGAFFSITVFAKQAPCAPSAPCAEIVVYQEVEDSPSWIFRRGTYTHDPSTGARVAQYMRTPPVEPLEDERLVTSRYRRSRTNLRGAHGSVDTYYEVQAWGNGRGGIDAEWERFHDAWKESYLMGGYYNQGPGYGNQGPGYGNQGPGYGGPWGYGGGYAPGYGNPGYGYGGGQYGPGYGFPGQGQGGHGHQGGHHDHGGHHGGDDGDGDDD